MRVQSSTPSQKQFARIDAICDAARLLFCAVVISSHFLSMWGGAFPYFDYMKATSRASVLYQAPWAVWGLFLLSGFFFHRSNIAKPRPLSLLKSVLRRFWRLWPLFALSHVVMGLVCYPIFSPFQVIEGASLLSNFHTYLTPNSIGWTVITDFHFHIASLLLITVWRPSRSVHFLLMLVGAVAVRYVFGLAGMPHVPYGAAMTFWNFQPDLSTAQHFASLLGYDVASIPYQPEVVAMVTPYIENTWTSTAASWSPFVLGWWLSHIVTSGQRIGWLLWWPVRVLVPLLYFSPWAVAPGTLEESMKPGMIWMHTLSFPIWSLFFMALLYQLFHTRQLDVLKAGPMRFLGSLTYAAYLFQFPPFILAIRLMPPSRPLLSDALARLGLSYALICVIAVVLHVQVEERFK